jgi:hypothetical protein
MTERPYLHGNRHSAIINKMYFQILGTGTKGYCLEFADPSSTNDNLVISIGDGTALRTLIQYNSINDLTLNQWHYVVGSGDGNNVSIYIDGQLKSSATTGGYTILNDATSLALGTETTSGAKDVWFNGIMDEVMIYNRALSANEITTLYSYQIPTPTPSPSPSPTSIPTTAPTSTPTPTLSPTTAPTQNPTATPSPTPPTGIFNDANQTFLIALFSIIGLLIVIIIVLIYNGRQNRRKLA